MSYAVFSGSPVGHFTHCFALVKNGDYWTRIDSTYGRIVTETVGDPDPDVLNEIGFPCLEYKGPVKRIFAPIQPFTCVAIVKRALGIGAFWIVTTKQLHDYLARKQNAWNP